MGRYAVRHASELEVNADRLSGLVVNQVPLSADSRKLGLFSQADISPDADQSIENDAAPSRTPRTPTGYSSVCCQGIVDTGRRST